MLIQRSRLTILIWSVSWVISRVRGVEATRLGAQDSVLRNPLKPFAGFVHGNVRLCGPTRFYSAGRVCIVQSAYEDLGIIALAIRV